MTNTLEEFQINLEKGNIYDYRKHWNSEDLLSLYINMFDTIFNGVVVVDKEGYITLINKSYCDFINVKQAEVIGKHVTEVLENTRMHIVADTGIAEIGEIQKIQGNQMVANRIPIFKNGKTFGAVGTVIFKDIVEIKDYMKKISNLEQKLQFYKEELKKALGSSNNFGNIIGNSQSLAKVKKLAQKVAGSKSNILILGESGTGKGLFAQAIHNASSRADHPMIQINCGAIPSELLESELFGYEDGAFTGAKKGGKPGKFELANKSTIFLDEIGDTPLNLQVKLLKVIQEKEIERIGGTKSQKLDVRIIAATNRDLKKMVENKEFREDLYYRLNVINIRIPPLRERIDDIPLIAKHLLKKLAKEMEQPVPEISIQALQALKQYDWPGNIRELENILEMEMNLIDSEMLISYENLPYYITKEERLIRDTDKDKEYGTLKVLVGNLEKKVITETLEKFNGNKQEVAKILGISRTSLYQKMEKYGISECK